MSQPIRVLVAKAGLDGHDRGAKVIARALRDAGMEVIYTGLHQTPEAIVTASVQEDVDCVAISILSGAHMTLIPRVVEGLRKAGAEDVIVLAGGIIPPEDAEELLRLGVSAVHGPGTSLKTIVESITDAVGGRSITRS
jgi:methylmalonyl-CoA mutase C-terminal domain/subunit